MVPVLLAFLSLFHLTPETPMGNPHLVPGGTGGFRNVARSGHGFLVVWAGVQAVRFDAGGQPLDLTPLRITHDTVTERIAIASDGEDYLIAYPVANRTVSVVRIASDGTPAAKRTDILGQPAHELALAWVSDHYLLVFITDDGAVREVDLDRDGRPFGTPVTLGTGAQRTAIASNGGVALVLWESDRIHGAFVGVPGSFTLAGSDPDVTWDGSSFLVAWRDAAIHLGATNGQAPSTIATLSASSAGRLPQIAATRGAIAVVWQDPIPGGDIVARNSLIDRAGNETRRDEIGRMRWFPKLPQLQPRREAVTANETVFLTPLITRQAADTAWQPAKLDAPRARARQSLPAIASGSNQPAVVWREGDRLVAQIASREPVVLATGVDFSSNLTSIPVIAAGSASYLVVWNNFGAILGARIALDGTLLDAKPFRIATGQLTHIAVSWDGRNYVVAYVGQGSVIQSWSMNVVRVSEPGQVLDPSPIVLGESTDSIDSISIASVSGRSLIVWPHMPDCCNLRLAARMLAADGTPGDLLAIANDRNDRIQLNANDDGFLVVWQKSFKWFARAIAVDSALGEQHSVPVAAINEFPVMAWNGREHVVVWSSESSDSSLFALLLNRDGTAAGTPFVLTTPATHASELAAAGGTAGFHLGYTRFDESQRLFTHTVTHADRLRRRAM